MQATNTPTRAGSLKFRAEPSVTRQSGVALITAMLIISLVAIISVDMMSDQQLSIRRTGNHLLWDQALQYAQGGEVWARGILRRDRINDEKTETVDHLNEDWASELPLTPIDGGSIGGMIRDMQAQFNINNLFIDTENKTGEEQQAPQQADRALKAFKRLLADLELETSIADAVVDWMDTNVDTRFPDGAEDLAYSEVKNPYRTANRRLAHISELRLVKGVDHEVYEQLLPYVTALPETTRVNVNTASSTVIAALAKEIDSETAKEIVEIREQTPYNSYQDFQEQLKKLLPKDRRPGAQLKELVDVKSSYFRVEAQVQLDKLQLVTHSALKRSNNNNIGVLYRTQGFE